MSKFLLTVCAFGLLLSSASAQETLTDTELLRRDGLVKKHLQRFVPSGKSRMVGFFTGAHADCSVWELKAMDVQTTNAPEHGTVEIVPGESFMTFAKDGTPPIAAERNIAVWLSTINRLRALPGLMNSRFL